MIRRAIVFAAMLIVAAACSHIRPTPAPTAARLDFLDGVEAHRKGADDEAAADWDRCLKRAAPGGQDEEDCRISSDLLKELSAAKSVQGAAAAQAPAAPKPRLARAPAASVPIGPSPADALHRAQQSYLEGVVYYQNGDWEKARAAWKKCFLEAPPDSEVASDCRSGLAKLGEEPPSPPRGSRDAERRAQQSYLEGVVYFQKGDYMKAGAAWKKCVGLAAPGADEAADCRAGLERLGQLFGDSSTPPDGKK
jgi:tetratricopeptide (TPR) repeat protein